LHGALGKEFFLKKLKTVFADDLCQVRSAQDFLKKNRKRTFADGLCQGLSAQVFSKKK
jgi:hypothetical protein